MYHPETTIDYLQQIINCSELQKIVESCEKGCEVKNYSYWRVIDNDWQFKIHLLSQRITV